MRSSFSISRRLRSSAISASDLRASPASFERDPVVRGVRFSGEWGRPQMPPVAVAEFRPSLCRSVLTL